MLVTFFNKVVKCLHTLSPIGSRGRGIRPAPVASPSVILTRLRPCGYPPPRAVSPSGQKPQSTSWYTLGEHDPGALSNFLLRVMRHNRHLSALIVSLGCVDIATVCKGLEDNMPNIKAKTKKSKAGSTAETTDADVFFAPMDKGILFA